MRRRHQPGWGWIGKLCGDWVPLQIRWGARLLSIRSGGHPASLTHRQMAELKEMTIKGPDLEKDNVVRWRCVDLRDEVARRFMVTVTERTMSRRLCGLELTRLQPRPFHPKKDVAAQAALKKELGFVGPPVALETGRAIPRARGADGKFLMDLTP
jgi:hypothetical protein